MLKHGWSVSTRSMLASSNTAEGTVSASSLTFLSNFTFLGEAGYFDTASAEKWLLHTWSLSVEWQFYLLFPLLLLIAWKAFPKRLEQVRCDKKDG